MRTNRVFLLLALIVMSSGCQTLGTKESVKLSSDEVINLFKEHTVESYNLSNGATSFTYYATDGSLIQERYWGIRTGLWKVTEQGEICLSMENKPFKCREIYQIGDKYYKYRMTKKEKSEKAVRYRQFIPGKAI